MPPMSTLRVLANRGREVFLEAVTRPHLHFPEGFDPTGSGFHTSSGHAGRAGSPQALPVEKTSSPFSFMVTIGRAKNNDIVAPDPRVSKFHCYLRPGEDGWTIADAGSSNGTEVDGVRLTKDQQVPLRSGARLSLGGCPARFLSAADLYEQATALDRARAIYLQKMAAEAGA